MPTETEYLQLKAEHDALRTALLSQPWWNASSGESAQVQLNRLTENFDLMGRRWMAVACLAEQAVARADLAESYLKVLADSLGLCPDIQPEDLLARIHEQKTQLDVTRAQLRVLGSAMDRAASG